MTTLDKSVSYKGAIREINRGMSALRGVHLQDPLRVLNGALDAYSKARIQAGLAERALDDKSTEIDREAYNNLTKALDTLKDSARGYARRTMQISTASAEGYVSGLIKQVSIEETGRRPLGIGGTFGIGKVHLFKTKKTYVKLPVSTPSAVAIGRAIDDAGRYVTGQKTYVARIGASLNSAGILEQQDEAYLKTLGSRFGDAEGQIDAQRQRHQQNVDRATGEKQKKAEEKKISDDQSRLKELDKQFMKLQGQHSKDIRKRKWY